MKEETPEQFMDYFRRNYPGPNTIIHSPDWHAPKIYRAAIAASGHKKLVDFIKRFTAHLERMNCITREEQPFMDEAAKLIDEG